jgi:hypothetical protein
MIEAETQAVAEALGGVQTRGRGATSIGSKLVFGQMAALGPEIMDGSLNTFILQHVVTV